MTVKAAHSALPDHREAWRLAALIFAQMLPATLVVPAIRPLFALQHAGQEGAMHAFMALNMLGGFLAAPLVGAFADRCSRGRSLLGGVLLADALLLICLPGAVPTATVLGLRIVEGALHVAAATLLLSRAAALGRSLGDGRMMGLAGSAIMVAIAVGSALGGLVLRLDVRGPFWLGGLILTGVAAFVASAGAAGREQATAAAESERASGLPLALAVPISSAFIERFCVGCMVVTFALFAHKAHGISDTAVGMLFTLMMLPFALLTYPLARLGDRIPRASLLGLGTLVFAGSLFCLVFVSADGLPVLMVAAGGGCAMMFAPTLCYAATLAEPRYRNRAMALLNGAGCLGMLLGPAAAGIISSVFRSASEPAQGYRAVFIFAGCSLLAWFGASSVWLRRRLGNEVRGAFRAVASTP